MADQELHCSFCNKSQRNVRRMLAGPFVQICDECVDICAGMNADLTVNTPAEGPLLTTWCALCHLPIDAEPALLVEGRGVLCPQCVAEIEASLDARRN